MSRPLALALSLAAACSGSGGPCSDDPFAALSASVLTLGAACYKAPEPGADPEATATASCLAVASDDPCVACGRRECCSSVAACRGACTELLACHTAGDALASCVARYGPAGPDYDAAEACVAARCAKACSSGEGGAGGGSGDVGAAGAGGAP
jgi:hypothetical protein